MRNRKGFTMVELLVVLVIIAILAAVATPIYLANVKRSRASEAVSSMALIRQAQRDFQVAHNAYFDVAALATDGNIQLPLPLRLDAIATDGTPDPDPSGVDVDAGVAQYFSNAAYSVDAQGSGDDWTSNSGTSGMFTDPSATDFLVFADGSDTVPCTATSSQTNCATKGAEVVNYALEMDNSGRTFVCYDWNGATCDENWAAY